MKYAATAIVCGVVAGAGRYFGGAATVSAVEKTVTKIVTGPTTTVTKTVREEPVAPSGKEEVIIGILAPMATRQ